MSQVPFSVPDGWANGRTAPRIKFALIVFGALSVLSLVTIVRSGNWSSGLFGAVAFGAFAFIAWALGQNGITSLKAMRIANAVVMTKAVTPPPDDWVHFVKFRPVPWPMVATFAVLGGGCIAVAAWMAQFGADGYGEEPTAAIAIWVMGAATGALGLFFVVGAIRSIITQTKGTGWPRLHGFTLGEHGIANRLVAGESSEFTWEQITGIAATFVTSGGARHAPIPVLQIETGETSRSYNVRIFDASPVLTHTALQFYWRNPELRHELGTTSGTKRMAEWLAEIAPKPAAPAAPFNPGRA